jgi:hypothetical protein
LTSLGFVAETAEPPNLVGVRHAFTSYLYLPDTTVVDVVLAEELLLLLDDES